jgi:hypothetical protein
MEFYFFGNSVYPISFPLLFFYKLFVVLLKKSYVTTHLLKMKLSLMICLVTDARPPSRTAGDGFRECLFSVFIIFY